MVIKLRVARPTDNLKALAEMYRRGLGFEVLAEFSDHDGFDGIILGRPGYPYHLEFTSERNHKAGGAPSNEHLLIFYIPEKADWDESCSVLRAAGFKEVASHNPFWERTGKTFEDLDGYRLVIQHGEWTT